MKKFLRMRKKGFTLIELMIVIAIIAILAAILIPNFIRARAQSQLAACESNLKNIATSLEMYSTDYNGNYPYGSTTADTVLTPNYMRTLPVCPIDSLSYVYDATNIPAAYTISQDASNPHQGYVGTSGLPTGCSAYPCYGSSGGLTIGK